MKTSFKAGIFAALLGAVACGPSSQSNKVVSDTTSILDTTRLNSALDTTAVQDVKATGATQTAVPSQHQESTGNQANRTSVGTDTTGKQPHDNTHKH